MQKTKRNFGEFLHIKTVSYKSAFQLFQGNCGHQNEYTNCCTYLINQFIYQFKFDQFVRI